MIFLDINTFFGAKAGGIRTYHQAKIDYFLRHSHDSYFLVYPGPVHKVENIGANVTLVQVYGKQLTRDPKGYRLLLDYPKVYKLIKKEQPDIIEAGDSYLTGLFTLFAPFPRNIIRSSFFHSDSIETYLKPWINRHKIIFGEKIIGLAEKLFVFLQKKFDMTLVASRMMEKKLHQRGITKTSYTPFGNDPIMLETFSKRQRKEAQGKIRLLYAARLDLEKNVDMFLEIIPDLLENPMFSLSVAGRGQFEDEFVKIDHPRYNFFGYVSSREELADIFSRHDIFLATSQYETFGLAILEAMAAGLVVVGPDRGETAERLKQLGSPYIFKTGDKDSFLEKILAASRCDLTKEMQTSNAFAKKFGGWEESIEHMVLGYKKIAQMEKSL